MLHFVTICPDLEEKPKDIQNLNIWFKLRSHFLFIKNLFLVSNPKKVSDIHQLKIARWTTLVVGRSSMFLSFYCKDLLDLLMLSFAFSLPVVTAPFLLAIFGFRGTSRTALIGMATGGLSILAWNKWIKSITGIDGSLSL